MFQHPAVQRVFAAVRSRLKAGGYYLISTAMFDPLRFHAQDLILDQKTGKTYYRYGIEDLMDAEQGIVYYPFDQPDPDEAVIRVNGKPYLPCRRHRKPAELKAELETAGFTVLYQDEGYGGNMICQLRVDPAHAL